MSEDICREHTDEKLLDELKGCCSPNCLIINEVVRRFKELRRLNEEL